MARAEGRHTQTLLGAGERARFVVTGPGGWIGQAMLAHLAEMLGDGLASRVRLFGSAARDVAVPGGGTLPVKPIAAIRPDDLTDAHVIHLAWLGKEKVDELGTEAFLATNAAIDDAVIGALAASRPASLFVASSGAAAAAQRGEDHHPYATAKLRQEERFLGWARAAFVPTIAGRIYSIAGPHMNKLSGYALSSMILAARGEGEIVIQANRPLFRSFLHVADLCALIIGAGLARMGSERPVDFCGAEVLEIADLAEAVAREVGGRLGQTVTIRRGGIDCGQASIYLGDFTQTRILALRTEVRLADLRQQVADTVDWLEAAQAIAHQPALAASPAALPGTAAVEMEGRVAQA